MAQPEEFKIHIEPDGRVIFESGTGMQETSWRRVIELIEETVGPVVEVKTDPSDPPRIYLAPQVQPQQKLRNG